jgi:hypothetical protein
MPLETKSYKVVVPSAPAELANKYKFVTLYGFLEASTTTQSSITFVRLIKTNLGLNPKYKNTPSADPLPV